MPTKDGQVYCINHPDETMRVLNEGREETFHTMRLATIVYRTRLQMENKSTLFTVFACPRCGYTELYLPPQEMALLKQSEKA
ncbi:MAG: hypothetical protein N2Z74_08005 [Syntrophales bacterium]|nr:hypothetical protein [Syntrophales bacterium]